MKNVFLIGDSIRYGTGEGAERANGYGWYLPEMFEGVANVYQPDDNCRFAEYTLRYLHEWAKEVDGESIDVVHWNNGLWDLALICQDDPLTPKDIYAYFLKKTYDRIRYLFPNAKIIFALTTPVTERPFTWDFARRNSDIIEYNEVARKTLEPLGVHINDLYTLACEVRKEHPLDWVHYNPTGSKILAQRVHDEISKLL